MLIANRGEIAIRIARAADALDMDSVAVHPAVDKWSLHTRVATESRLIGGPSDAISAYLDVDAIVAAENAEFIDNTVAMGVCGAEFFHHPWEVGIRQAKEMLYTSDAVSAADAFRLGMVNHVVALDELQSFALTLAEKIAQRPLFALKLTKEAVNAAQDAQGRGQALGTSFALHQLCHSHNQQVYGMAIDPSFQMATARNRQ